MDMDEILRSIYSSEPKAADQVWKDMVEGKDTNNIITTQHEQHMTLEDFLTNKATAAADGHQEQHGTIVVPPSSSSGTRRRGKRKGHVEEPLLDKATLQKQKRMIKNRESAARSRERKQAYTVELESLVVQLEEENKRLLREEADKNKQRLKQLMEFLIPVTEKRKPRGMLRRVNSVQW
ncbi:hypothetical protein RIF29_41685 [Crotalaria pallida]|uniref:BZIP domain-containing protein n=1 Tax=Crotalaria pallida TaxID=3830 RepID=A0AAN9E633_CROPI